ncbi:hypothetical protein PG995_005105 [Apiospora arundinis]
MEVGDVNRAYGYARSTGTTRVQFKALHVLALAAVSGSLNANVEYINKTAVCASAVINRLEVLVFVLFVGSISGNAGVTLCRGQSCPSNSTSATFRQIAWVRGSRQTRGSHQAVIGFNVTSRPGHLEPFTLVGIFKCAIMTAS